jgi:hypothetical protein
MKKMVLVSEIAALSRMQIQSSVSEFLPDTEQFKSKNLTAFMSDEEGSTLSMQSVKDFPDVDAAKTLPKLDTTSGYAETQPSNNSASLKSAGGAQQPNSIANQNSATGSTQSINSKSEDQTPPSSPNVPPSPSAVPKSVGGNGGVYVPAKQQTIMDLLESWEEPERFDHGMVRNSC